MNKRKISMIFFIIGLLVFGISLILPVDILEAYTNLRPVGIGTLIVCPILGIIGLLFAIKEKTITVALLNVLLILSFPIVMLIGYSLV